MLGFTPAETRQTIRLHTIFFIFCTYGAVFITVPPVTSTTQCGGQQSNFKFKSHLKASADNSRNILQTRRRSLKVIQAEPVGLLVGRCYGYPEKEVLESLQQAKGEFLHQIEGEEYAGVRAYLEQKYPDSKTLKVSCETRKYTLYTKHSVDSAFNEASKLFARLGAVRNDGRVTFKVVSHPSDASFTVRDMNENVVREITTPDDVSNLWLGLYWYRIRKEGFKTVDSTLDLMEERFKSLDCTLIDNQSKDDALVCRRVK